MTSIFFGANHLYRGCGPALRATRFGGTNDRDADGLGGRNRTLQIQANRRGDITRSPHRWGGVADDLHSRDFSDHRRSQLAAERDDPDRLRYARRSCPHGFGPGRWDLDCGAALYHAKGCSGLSDLALPGNRWRAVRADLRGRALAWLLKGVTRGRGTVVKSPAGTGVLIGNPFLLPPNLQTEKPVRLARARVSFLIS